MPVPGAVFPRTLPRILRLGFGEHRGGSARPMWALPGPPPAPSLSGRRSTTRARSWQPGTGASPRERCAQSGVPESEGEKVGIPHGAWGALVM